jgi:hypothetical protein
MSSPPTAGCSRHLAVGESGGSLVQAGSVDWGPPCHRVGRRDAPRQLRSGADGVGTSSGREPPTGHRRAVTPRNRHHHPPASASPRCLSNGCRLHQSLTLCAELVPVVHALSHDGDRARCEMKALLAHRAEQEPAEPVEATCPDRELIGSLGGVQQGAGREVVDDLAVDGRGAAGSDHVGHNGVQRGQTARPLPAERQRGLCIRPRARPSTRAPQKVGSDAGARQ